MSAEPTAVLPKSRQIGYPVAVPLTPPVTSCWPSAKSIRPKVLPYTNPVTKVVTTAPERYVLQHKLPTPDTLYDDGDEQVEILSLHDSSSGLMNTTHESFTIDMGANGESSPVEDMDTRSSSARESSTDSTGDENDSFIIEDGEEDHTDIVAAAVKLSSIGSESLSPTNSTESEFPGLLPKRLNRSVSESSPPPTNPTTPPKPLHWHIADAAARKSLSADASNQGFVELNIRNGRISCDHNREDLSKLITVMHPMECTSTLEFDLNYINNKVASWKPMLRKQRVRSHLDDTTAAGLNAAADKKQLKRKWKSMDFGLELDPAGQMKRVKKPDLKCDESIVGNSSEDLSDSDQPSGDSLSPELVMMPGSVNGHADEDTDQESLPAMVEGMPMFNNNIDNSLEGTKLRVREFFAPTNNGDPEPNGFDFLHWQSNVGVLFGSNLSFFVNRQGLVDLKCTKPPQQDKAAMAALEEAERIEKQQAAMAKRSREERPVVNVATPSSSTASPVKVPNGKDKPDKTPPAHIAHQELKNSFWDNYMMERKSYAAPAYLFEHLNQEEHPIRKDMLVEVIDPQNEAQLRIGLVVDLQGKRLTVMLGSNRVCYNKNSWKLFPIGTALTLGMKIDTEFVTKKRSPGKYMNILLADRLRQRSSLFRPNLQVEAYDWKVTRTIRPATIRMVIANRLLIVFDYEEATYLEGSESSYWCTDNSPLIRPIDYHTESGEEFTEPYEGFTWPRYLMERKTVAAPDSAFVTRKCSAFRVGMQLELVDLVNPTVHRPATIKAVGDYEVKLCYDGFPESGTQSFAFWLWDDSEEMVPIGWCGRSSNTLVVQSDVETHCTRRFCRDLGNVSLVKMYHAQKDTCPYKMPIPGLSQGRGFGLHQVFSKLPKLKQNEDVVVPEELITELTEKVKKQAGMLSSVREYGPAKRDVEVWKKHVANITLPSLGGSPLLWTAADVAHFINQVPQCSCLGSVFFMHDIDGEALLSLTQNDLIESMGLKFGVSTKITAAIYKLRARTVMELFDM